MICLFEINKVHDTYFSEKIILGLGLRIDPETRK